MTANEYPITQPYGYDPSYPLNNGFHRGVDYGAPTGTAVVVNGVTVALTGATGAATGPHLHLGKWNGGIVLDPGNGGFDLVQPARVSYTSYDDTNGNYVKITDGNNITWIYCHLSKINVKTGDVIEGGSMYKFDEGDVKYWIKYFVGQEANANDLEFAKPYIEKQDAAGYLDQGIVHHPNFVPAFQLKDRIKELEAGQQFEEVPFKTYKKKG